MPDEVTEHLEQDATAFDQAIKAGAEAIVNAAETPVDPWAVEVEAWFEKHFHNKGYFNEAASACHAAKEDLLAFLNRFHHHPK